MIKSEKDKLNNEAQIIINNYKAGNLLEAEKRSKKLIQKYPHYVILYNILGLALSGQKKYPEAINFYNKALKIKPDFAIVHNNLGNLMIHVGKKHEAKKCFIKAIELEPKFALAHNNLGNFYKDLNKFDEAIKCFKKAIECEPQLFATYNNLGVAFQSIGNFKDAKKSFREALKINPKFYIAHRHISVTTKYTNGDPHIKEMEKLIAETGVTKDQKMNLSFGLGKAYEDIKDYNKAFEYFANGNQIKRENYQYSIKDDELFFKKIKECFNEKIFKDLKDSGVKDNLPIFIVGMPRSGTTLVEQILSSHPDVFGAGELDDFKYCIIKNFEINNQNEISKNLINDTKKINQIGYNYIERLKKINNKEKHISDKAPLNFRWIGLIKLALPNAKIIHCARNSKDTCLSLFKNFFAGDVGFAYNLKEMGQYHNLYKDLMNHWHSVLPGFVYDINYEDLASDQKEQTKKLLDICKLDWNDKCMEFYKNNRAISTASVAQARKPMYKDSVNSWEKYKVGLKPLLKVLNE